MRRVTLITFILLTLFPASSDSILYRPGDWVSYSSLRFVNAIAVDHRYAYFATTGGVSRYNLSRDQWDTPLTTTNGLIDNRVNVVAVDPLFFDLWCATRSGVSRYTPGTEKWTDHISGSGVFLTDIHSIGVTDDGRLLFENTSGVAVFDLSRNIWIDDATPGGLALGSPRVLRWYGARNRQTYTYPLFHTDLDYRFDPPETIRDRNFQYYPITTFENDGMNNVWVGTWGLNVGKGSLRTMRMSIERIGLYSRNVTAIAPDGDFIWFAGGDQFYDPDPGFRFGAPFEEPGGLTRYNSKTGAWDYFTADNTVGIPPGAFTDIEVDSGFIWFGMENGLVLYDRTEKLWTPVSPQGMISEAVTALAVTGSDVWIGARSGLNRMNRHLRVIEPVAAPALRNLRIFDLAVDDRWTLWVAASSGVFQHTPSGVWKKVEDTASSNLNGAVYDIEMDGDRIWFAIRHTLLRYDRNSGAWESYPTPLKIGDRPFEIRVSDRHIWVGSDRGGARFDKRTHIWTIFTGRDGLLDEAIQALAIEGDFIWFGSREGVTRFRWNDPTRVE